MHENDFDSLWALSMATSLDNSTPQRRICVVKLMKSCENVGLSTFSLVHEEPHLCMFFPSFIQNFSVFRNHLGETLRVDVKCGSWANIKCYYTPGDYIPEKLLDFRNKKTLNCFSFFENTITVRNELRVSRILAHDNCIEIDAPFQEGSFFFC